MASAAETLAFEVRLKDFMTKELKRLSMSTKTETAKVGHSFTRLNKTMARVGKTVKAIGLMMKVAFAAAVFMGIRNAVRTLREFSRGMAEVRTILDETTLSFEYARAKVIELTYTTTAAGKEIAKGLYQTLSAGITDGAEAMIMLEGASKLSIGALTTVNESVDLLTNTFNAYGMAVTEEAVQATTDLMFATVKLGKTTGPELSHSLGMVMPVAANLGVSLEELNAMLAALTLGGMKTSMAATQLRQAFAQLLHPSDDAKKLMKEYGIEVSAARVRAEGFLPVLKDVKEKFGDNAIALRTLFPNIRALVGVMALAGNQYDDVGRIMGEFADKHGAVDQAVEIMRNSLDHKMKLISSAWGNFWIGLVKEMKGAITELSTNELERFSKESKKVGEEWGAILAPFTTAIPVFLSLLSLVIPFMKEIAAKATVIWLGVVDTIFSAAARAAELSPIMTEKLLGKLQAAASVSAHLLAEAEKSLQGIEEEGNMAALSTMRMAIAYADVNGMGHLISDNMRQMAVTHEQILSFQERGATKAKAEAEATALKKKHLDVFLEQLKELRQVREEGGKSEEMAVRGMMALRAEAHKMGINLHLSESEYRIANAIQTADHLKNLELKRSIEAGEIAEQALREQFDTEMGYIMSITQERIDSQTMRLDHEKVLFKDLSVLETKNFQTYKARKEQEAQFELRTRRLKLDTAFLEMVSSEDFQKQTREQREKEISEYKDMRLEQLQSHREAVDKGLTHELREWKKAHKATGQSFVEMLSDMKRKGVDWASSLAQEWTDKLITKLLADFKEKWGFALADIAGLMGTGLAEALGKSGTSLNVIGDMFEPSAQENLANFTAHIKEARAEAARMRMEGFISPEQLESLLVMIQRVKDLNQAELELAERRSDLAKDWNDFGMTWDNVTRSMGEGLEDWAAQVGTVSENISELTAVFIDGFINAFINAIEMAVDGTKKWEEAFQEFGRMFLRMMVQMILKQIMLNTLHAMFPTWGFMADGGVVEGGTGDVTPLASGGVVSGGLGRALPVKGYATGGPIVSSPHVAVIGEGMMNEAVVPLPDGRSIPVQMKGGGDGSSANVNISISTVDAAGVDELLIQRQSTLRNIIRQAMDEDRSFRQAVRQR